MTVSTRPYAKPMTTGGVAAEMKDLKNRPMRMRISRMVKGSILSMSVMAPTSVSWEMADEPVTYVVRPSVLAAETADLTVSISFERAVSQSDGNITETSPIPSSSPEAVMYWRNWAVTLGTPVSVVPYLSASCALKDWTNDAILDCSEAGTSRTTMTSIPVPDWK